MKERKSSTDATCASSAETADGNGSVHLDVKGVITGLITYLFRFCVGGIFIFSGYVKAIDPWGTIYKFNEYIASLGADWLYPLVTAGAFMLCSFEFLIGVSLMLGSFRRWSAICAMALMIFMLPLTLWIAIADPVADCGCFGDALILSNWHTFWKNLVITAMCIWLIRFNMRIRCLVIPTLQVIMISVSLLFINIIALLGYNVQPLQDYRPYPSGSMLLAGEDETDAGILAIWDNGKTRITIPADSIPEGEQWTFVERVQPSGNEEKQAGKNLAIYDSDQDVTEDVVIEDGKQVILFIPDIEDVSVGSFYKLNSLYAFSRQHEVDMFAVAAGNVQQINDFIDLSLAEYPIYTAEDTAIKEVVRGNPGVVYLEDGKIIWKSTLAALPTDDFMDGMTGTLNQFTRDDSGLLRMIISIYLLALLTLILLSHVPMCLRFISSRKFRRCRTLKLIMPLFALLSLASCSTEDEPLPAPSSEELTVIVYMVASNNLYNNSIIDIEEMKMAVEKLPAGQLNLLVYYVENTGESNLLRIKHNGKQPASSEILRHYTGNALSLTPERVSQVISDAVAFAPAKKYGLFLWSHATNWLPASKLPALSRSFGYDYGKEINITQLSAALPDHMFSFIWMDCCLMGSVECAYQFRNKCEYYVAYPTEVLAAGVPYDRVITTLCSGSHPIVDAADVAYDYFAGNDNPAMKNFTISVVKSSELDNLARVCGSIFNPDISINMVGLQGYGRHSGVSFYDALQSFQRMDAHAEYTRELDEAFSKAVIYKAATPKMLSYTIDPSRFSGLSATLYQTLSNQNQINLYHELDWYKAICAQ